jgi:hypothetical protein
VKGELLSTTGVPFTESLSSKPLFPKVGWTGIIFFFWEERHAFDEV